MFVGRHAFSELLQREPESTPTVLAREVITTSPLITPSVQLELAENGSIVLALFTLYLIVHESRLILQTLFLGSKAQSNNRGQSRE